MRPWDKSIAAVATPEPADAHSAPEIGSAAGWPIILYFHHVCPGLRHYTSLTPTAFDRALGQLGERFAPLDPLDVPNVRGARSHPAPTCLLTFDDGYLDVFEHALPIMERRGWRAILFVTVGQVGLVESHPVRGLLPHMSWEQLEEARSRGHVVASHGYGHVSYGALEPKSAQRDIDKAREVLAGRLPGAPDWLAYPFGVAPRLALDLPSLCFGTVKASPLAWTVPAAPIRRTYLPADEPERWQVCLGQWTRSCESR